MTHYEVLGVSPDAPFDEIRRAYLGLARVHHPDAQAAAGGEGPVRADHDMRAINAAWTVLGHPARRRAYDESLGVDQGAPFQPFDAEDDEPDPRLAPDVPYRPGARQSSVRHLATLTPVLFVGTAVATFSFGLMVGSVALLGLSLGLLALAGGLFVLVPLVYMSDARRHG